MIKSYLKLAFRNISRKKIYTTINVIGLGVASAFCILVFLYMRHEQSFDKFHRNVDQLYRVEFSHFDGSRKEESKSNFFSFMMKKAEENNMIQTPPVFAGELQKNFPEVEHAIRIEAGGGVVRANNHSYKEDNNSAYVDNDFFTVFDFPLIEGNASSVLDEKNKIVLSENAAIKYFGKKNPLGQTLLFISGDTTIYTVSGVARNFPVNSSFRFDLIMPRNSTPDYKEEMAKGLGSFSDILIIELKKGTDPSGFERKLDAFNTKYFQATLKQWASFPGSNVRPENFHTYLRPFAEAHTNVSLGWGHYTDLKNIYQLACLGMVILIIACLNYILLTLTGTISRSHEVGIRKTVGAPVKQIILQFYTETQMLALFAVTTGFVLAVISLPLFSSLIGSDLQLDFFSVKDIFIVLLALAVTIGIVAGIYPAFVMSGLKPLNMMRKFSAYHLNPYLSKILVVTQFSVCIILIISTFVINKQMRFINEKDLGFDKDEIISISNPYWYNNSKNTDLLKERLAHFASTEPSIENFSNSSLQYNNMNNHLINGKKTRVEAFDIDYNYFSFFKIPLIKGRNFSPEIAEDSSVIKLSDDQHFKEASAARQAIIVNETLYNLLGRPGLNTINKSMGGVIIGVCKDYYPDDLTKNLVPAYHRINRGYVGSFSFRIKQGQSIPQVMDKLKSAWNNITSGENFSYSFLDETLAKNYETYLRWMRTMTASCTIAIIIACMGLFGLSGLTAMSRIREIGIRKIMGASVSDLFLLLNKGTFLMAMISFVVAIPLAVLLANEWLENFAYRITPDWWLFATAGIISVVTALIAVSYHTIKAARANPVDSLRAE